MTTTNNTTSGAQASLQSNAVAPSHTPTKWAVWPLEDDESRPIIVTGDGEYEICGGFNSPQDAAHIVKCVNHHDELVALLKEANSGKTQLQFRDLERRTNELLAKLEASDKAREGSK